MRACLTFTAILYHEDVEPAPGRAHLRFHDELQDHSPATERAFYVPGSVKDLVESCGVPHTEIGRIEIGDEAVAFDRIVHDGDHIDVYPAREALADPRFVLDVHLGRLAAYLRMLGFDAFYRSCFDDAEIAAVSAEEGRVLLTRDRGLLKRGNVARGYWLRATDSRLQAAEIIARYHLTRALRPFTRCMACNAELVDVAKSQVIDRLPPRTAQLYDEFRHCPRCRRVYWKGSHYRRMEQWIAALPLRNS
jgi:uncharacterized protein